MTLPSESLQFVSSVFFFKKMRSEDSLSLAIFSFEMTLFLVTIPSLQEHLTFPLLLRDVRKYPKERFRPFVQSENECLKIKHNLRCYLFLCPLGTVWSNSSYNLIEV